MKNAFRMLSIRIKSLWSREDGQDLLEYAFVMALIAFAATASMSSLANDINSAFGTIGNDLNASV